MRPVARREAPGWVLGVSAMTWLRALFMVVGGISGLIVVVGIASACAQTYYEGDEG
jgi:hypothetical protein